MKNKRKNLIITGTAFCVAFVVWTLLIKMVDVRPFGVNGTDIGFATVNVRFHLLTGVNIILYNITDWLGLVPLIICITFGAVGFFQLIKRKSLFKVDFDIIVSGVYYVMVVLCYLFFEMYPINFRPILINGIAEASYPSSTTLLVLTVMPTIVSLTDCRIKNEKVKKIIRYVTVVFCLFMVTGRVVSGVHWITDIIGSVFLSAGLFCIYKVRLFCLLR
jgi:undecaprenyl-diphosphatase